MRVSAFLAGVLAIVGIAHSDTPYYPITANFHISEPQFEIVGRVANTPIIRASFYQGTNLFSPTNYDAYFMFGPSINATSMVQITGTVYDITTTITTNVTPAITSVYGTSSTAVTNIIPEVRTVVTNRQTGYADFQVRSNHFSRPVSRWYAAVMLTRAADGEVYSMSYGELTIKQAPEANGAGIMEFIKILNGSEFTTFTGSFTHWPFILAEGFEGGYVSNATFQATNVVFQALIDALESATGTLDATSTDLQGQVTSNLDAQANTNAGFQVLHTNQANTNAGFQALFDAQVNTNAGFQGLFDAQVNTNAGFQDALDAQVNTNAAFQDLFDAQVNTNVAFQDLFDAQVNTNTGFQDVLDAQVNTNAGFQDLFDAQVNTNAGFQTVLDAQANTNAGFQSALDAQEDTNAAFQDLFDAQADSNAVYAAGMGQGQTAYGWGDHADAGYLSGSTNVFAALYAADRAKLNTNNLSGLTASTYTGIVAGTRSWTGACVLAENKTYVYGYNRVTAYGTSTLAIAGASLASSSAGAVSNVFTYTRGADSNLVLTIVGDQYTTTDITNIYVRLVTNGTMAVASDLHVGGIGSVCELVLGSETGITNWQWIRDGFTAGSNYVDTKALEINGDFLDLAGSNAMSGAVRWEFDGDFTTNLWVTNTLTTNVTTNLIVTGTLTPDVTGTYTYGGPYTPHGGDAEYWTNSVLGSWVATDSEVASCWLYVGEGGASSWQGPIGLNPTGDYTADINSTGTATVAYSFVTNVVTNAVFPEEALGLYVQTDGSGEAKYTNSLYSYWKIGGSEGLYYVYTSQEYDGLWPMFQNTNISIYGEYIPTDGATNSVYVSLHSVVTNQATNTISLTAKNGTNLVLSGGVFEPKEGILLDTLRTTWPTEYDDTDVTGAVAQLQADLGGLSNAAIVGATIVTGAAPALVTNGGVLGITVHEQRPLGTGATDAYPGDAGGVLSNAIDALESPYQAWTVLDPGEGETCTIAIAHGSLVKIEATNGLTTIAFDNTGYSTQGVSRVGVELWAGTNSIGFDSATITNPTAPTISTSAWNSLFFRRTADNDLWEGRQ